MNITPHRCQKTLLGVIFFMKQIENVCVFLTGGTVYGLLEMLWRGHTHWSMVLAGGIALLLIHLLNGRLSSCSLVVRCLVGATIITSIEFIAGIIFNIWLGMNVWDYSGVRFNLLGQICPMFFAVWFLISIPAFYLSRAARKFFILISENERGA